jgi:acetoin utilization deacetylase AcuC-like enzyme
MIDLHGRRPVARRGRELAIGVKKSGLVYDDVFLKHYTGPRSPETPHRLETVAKRITATGLKQMVANIPPVTDREAIAEAILAVHSRTHYDSVAKWGEKAEPALLAVGAVMAGVDAVMTGRMENVFCAVRPPGHHAHNFGANCEGRFQGEGFCFFNNVAVGARYAQRRHHVGRVLIVDWDYHHGNGTEWFFYDDPSVFYFSTHSLYDYPVTGFPDRRGKGKGKGFNLNVPLPGRAGDGEIMAAYESVLLPALRDLGFRPDLVMISAGFDARVDDPLGTFAVTDKGYLELTRFVKSLAQTFCQGRLVSVLEGGYNPQGMAQAVSVHLRALANGVHP